MVDISTCLESEKTKGFVEDVKICADEKCIGLNVESRDAEPGSQKRRRKRSCPISILG